MKFSPADSPENEIRFLWCKLHPGICMQTSPCDGDSGWEETVTFGFYTGTSLKRWETQPQSLLIINRKSHKAFSLLPQSMILVRSLNCHYVPFIEIWSNLKPTALNWLQLEQHYQWQKCNPENLGFLQYIIYGGNLWEFPRHRVLSEYGVCLMAMHCRASLY